MVKLRLDPFALNGVSVVSDKTDWNYRQRHGYIGNSSSSGGATVSDATSSVKGILQLAGDLSGTAAAPTVPELDHLQPTISVVVSSDPYADYVTDGTNDVDKFNEAITDLSALAYDGIKLIIAPDAEYHIYDDQIVPDDGIAIRGSGMGQTTFYLHGEVRGCFSKDATAISAVTDFSLSDFTIDGTDQTRANDTSLKGILILNTLRLRIQNVRVYNTTATGFGPDFNIDLQMTNCIADTTGAFGGDPGFNGFGIGTGLTNEKVQMTNCIAINCGNNGFLFERQFSVAFDQYPKHYQLTNCYAIGCRTGFRNSSSSSMSFIGCKAVSNDNEGFHLSPIQTNSPPLLNQLVGCEAHDNGDDGFLMSDDSRLQNFVVDACYSYNNAGDGFRCGGNRFKLTNSFSYNNKDNGLRIQPLGTNTTNTVLFTDTEAIQITGNTIYNNGIANTNGTNYGIYISGGTWKVTSAILSNNFIYDDQATPTQYYGIFAIGKLSKIHTRGNHVWGNYKGGIYEQITVASTSNDMAITDNVVFNNGRGGGTAPQLRGIYVAATTASTSIDGLMVLNNRCYDDQGTQTQTYGISLAGAITNLRMAGNDIRGNLTGGFLNALDSVVTNSIHDNKGINPHEFYDTGTITTSVAINQSNGDTQKITLGGNITYSINNGVNYGDSLLLEFMQDATGSRTATPSGSNISLTTAFTPTATASTRSFLWLSWDGIRWADVTRSNFSQDLSGYALLAGRAGSQTLNGGTASAENLNLRSTSHATKGKITLGASSAFDEANVRLGIGTQTPSFSGHVLGSDGAAPITMMIQNSVGAAAEARLFFSLSTSLGSVTVGASVYADRTDVGGAGSTDLLFQNSSGTTINTNLTLKADRTAIFAGAVTMPSIVITDGNIVLGTITGTKLGTATTQKLGLWNATPIVQPTTAVAAATFAANSSAIANDTATFDGYTIGQVVKALRNVGLLA